MSTWAIDWFSSAAMFPGWAEYVDEASLWRGPVGLAHRPSETTSIGNTLQFAAPSSMFVTVPYASEIHDDQNRFDPAAHRYAVESAGDYEVCVSIFDSYASTNRIPLELDLVKSGLRDKTIRLGEGAASGCGVTRAIAGDTLEVQLLALSPTALTMSPSTPLQ